jgi:hypothetical protein
MSTWIHFSHLHLSWKYNCASAETWNSTQYALINLPKLIDLMFLLFTSMWLAHLLSAYILLFITLTRVHLSPCSKKKLVFSSFGSLSLFLFLFSVHGFDLATSHITRSSCFQRIFRELNRAMDISKFHSAIYSSWASRYPPLHQIISRTSKHRNADSHC